MDLNEVFEKMKKTILRVREKTTVIRQIEVKPLEIPSLKMPVLPAATTLQGIRLLMPGILTSVEAQEAEKRLFRCGHGEIDAGSKKTENRGQIESLTVILEEQKTEEFLQACYEAGRIAAEALRKLAEALRGVYEKMYLTEQEKRKRQQWRKYYLRKAEMTNNERRRRGLAMVRRPKKREYMVKRETKPPDGHHEE